MNVLFWLVMLASTSCQQKKAVHEETTLTFLQHVKNEEYSAAKKMLWKINDTDEILNYNLKMLHEFVSKYGVPSSDKWSVAYDTAYMVKRETTTIPLFKGLDNDTKLKNASVDIDYEYRGQHIGNLIFDFRVDMLYDR